MKNDPAKYFDKKVLIFYYQTSQKIKNWQKISFLEWCNGLVEVSFTVTEVYVLSSDSGQHTT